jgi:hypothetical protein
MADSQSEKIDAFFSDNERLSKAMGRAVQEALRVHKALGHSVVSWENGKVVIIPPEEIQLEEPANGPVKLPQDMIP